MKRWIKLFSIFVLLTFIFGIKFGCEANALTTSITNYQIQYCDPALEIKKSYDGYFVMTKNSIDPSSNNTIDGYNNSVIHHINPIPKDLNTKKQSLDLYNTNF